MNSFVSPNSRLTHLDGLRFFAFLSVFLSHSLAVPLLWAGVDCFFVLSGYLITGILLRSRESKIYYYNFYRRRFFRIFPSYYLLLIIVFFFLSKQEENTSSWFFFLYLSNFNSAYKWLLYPAILTPMWSLAIEEQFYLSWPFIIKRNTKSVLIYICIVLIILSPIIRAGVTIYSSNHWPVYYLTICRLDLLAFGALLSLIENRIDFDKFYKLTKNGLMISVLVFTIFLSLGTILPTFRTSSNSILFNSIGYSLIATFMFFMIAYIIPRPNIVLSRFLSLKLFSYFGIISYGMYLYHQLVLEFVHRLNLGKFQTSILALLLTIVLAMISWHVLEKPFQKLRDKRQ